MIKISINRPVLHSFDFFDFNFLNHLVVNTNNRLLPKIFNGFTQMLENESAEKCDRICGNMWHICKFLPMQFRKCHYMQKNM